MREAAQRSLRALTALVFLAVFNVVLLAASSWPALYDTDSTYHVAAAREYARHGMLKSLPWARFSALGPGFGDKELLFHILLAPFTRLADPVAGGKLALALLAATTAAVLARLSIRALGAWGALMPVFIFATACDFTLRALRLRPETLALLLFLAATVAAARRRYLLLGLCAFAFALSYTAVHALLGLAALLFVRVLWLERRREWKLLLAPASGAALGLVAHPQLPSNLRIFWLQNVTFLQMKSWLDVGLEILPPTTLNLLALNAGWIAGMLILLATRRPPADRVDSAPDDARRRLADFLLVGAAVFGLLYLFSMRFSTYFVPFATLALAWRIHVEGGLGARTRLPWRGGVPRVLALALPVLAVPYAWNVDRINLENAGVFVKDRPANDAALGQALPAGARVAATWQNAETYVLAAPQARYLNLLDPVFMAVPFPEVYEAQRALFSGEDRDPVLTAATTLESDYLAFANGPHHSLLTARLASDPRVTRLHDGLDTIYRLDGRTNHAFVLDWTVAPKGVAAPPPRGKADGWASYPRAGTARGRAFEGYVDAKRVSTDACVTFVNVTDAALPALVTYELAASGPTTVFLDGDWIASAAEAGAVLGRGVTFPVRLAAGRHELSVSTCPAHGASGFALVERARSE
jgi:hypothetical protein